VNEMTRLSNHRDTPIGNVRVIGIFAHIDAGKTTTSEAILYYTGRIHRPGSVDDGDTQLDWMEQERARGITITAAATTCHWHNCQINLIDTPGHIDFSAEVVRSIRVIDGAVIVLCGVGGIETQTETVWAHADRQNLPRLLFVNKLDRPAADFERVLADVRARLTPHAVALQIPIGAGGDFRGVVDLLDRRALVWRADGEGPAEERMPPDLLVRAAAARASLVDAICETDDALLRQHLDGHDPDPAALRAALRRATLAAKVVPVLCGSARERIGVQPLLDAIAGYLPSPADRPPLVGTLPGDGGEIVERRADPDAPVCMAAFKIVTDPHVGHLTWVRAFSGRLALGQAIYNPRTRTEERVGRIYRMHANRREHVDRMEAGDVMGLVGVKSAITGDTLCDRTHPITLEAFQFPEPVIAVALRPASDEERDRLIQCVARLCEEDPTLQAGFDSETGEEILAGIGELHLEIAVDRLRTEYGIVAQASPPQVAYRETVLRRAEATGSYRKQTGGHGHYAVVRLRVEPAAQGEGILFRSIASAAEVADQFVRATEAGVREALSKGVIAGYPVTGVRVTLLGGRFHEVDSDSMDFRIAGSLAVRQAVGQAHPALLEPIMQADINAGEEHLGMIVADLGRRRARVKGVQVRGAMRNVVAEVPLAEARGYATALRDFSHGRGTFTLEFRRYELVPDKITEQIVRQRQAEGKVALR
jgi:elongation factor G